MPIYYIVESRKDLKEITCKLLLNVLVDLSNNIKRIAKIKDDEIEELNDEYFLLKEMEGK